MTVLVIGLLLFLGVHSVRIVADGWRARTIERVGDKAWKAGYALVAVAGFVLVVWGYGLARQQPLPLWTPQPWAAHLASLLTLVAFVLLAAGNLPGNSIRARLHHPMVLGVKLWALAHLLANHTLADLLLFGGFLVWAVVAFRSLRLRDRASGKVYPPGQPGKTALAVVVGIALWAAFAFWAHAAWIGVRPFA